MRLSFAAVAALSLVAGCERSAEPARANETEASLPSLVPDANAVATRTPLEPPLPRTPGGLPDDRTPASEAPFSETSARGAAEVVRTYHALLEQRRYGDAWRLWSEGGRASGMSEPEFAASFARFSEYHAQVGAPGRIEGAAGSLYVEVPLQVHGRLSSGEPFSLSAPVRLRRCNNVPGCTEDQKRWRIDTIDATPRPAEN